MADGTTPSPVSWTARTALAHEASLEIQELIPVLTRAVHDSQYAPHAGGDIAVVARSMLKRIGDLNNLIYQAVIDEEPEVTDKQLCDLLGLAPGDPHYVE